MNKEFSDIKDKVCVVTGGCGVFGNIFSSSLLKAGAKVAIIDYKKGRCEDCAQNLAKKSGEPVLCVVANVLDRVSLIEARKEIIRIGNKNLIKWNSIFYQNVHR